MLTDNVTPTGFGLPGAAEISVGTWKNGQTKQLRDVFRDWKIGVPDSLGRTRLLPSTRKLATRNLNLETGLMEDARMVDVRECGVAPIVRIELSSGRVVRCATNQGVWTPHGWVSAGELAVNDLIGRQGKVPVGERVGIPKRLREGIQFWTTEQRDRIADVDSCHVCRGIFNKADLELDHVVPVSQDLRLALDVNNLEPICKPCHDVKSGAESWREGHRRRVQRNGVRFEAVAALAADGHEAIYSIEMPPPWHNVVSDGVIVRASGPEGSHELPFIPAAREATDASAGDPSVAELFAASD